MSLVVTLRNEKMEEVDEPQLGKVDFLSIEILLYQY